MYHIAQINIGRIRFPLGDPRMSGFMTRLDALNALADCSPGFVWRLQTNDGNATYFRPYPEDDRILLNMSVWESIETLKSALDQMRHFLWFYIQVMTTDAEPNETSPQTSPAKSSTAASFIEKYNHLTDSALMRYFNDHKGRKPN